MTPGDLSLSTTESTASIPGATSQLDGFLSVPGADLVLTQDGAGHYLSFYWRLAQQYGLPLDQGMDQPLQAIFAPIAIAPYLERIRQVLDYLVPLRFEYPFAYRDQHFVFDLTISPILMPHGTATTVVVMGQFLYSCSKERALGIVEALVNAGVSPRADRDRKRLDQIVQDIRRSLDLRTVWQQTVDGLGRALDVSRCLICPYRPFEVSLTVMAEYHQVGMAAMVGTEFLLTEEPYINQALALLKPVVYETIDGALPVPVAVLAIATTYQDQPNGLIVLHQVNPSEGWTDVEIDLLQEIADQVGTGIAHATLLEESRNLAAELQRANHSLMQQHRELEEAREQAEAASRLKSEFLANTSHELRTPLNGVIGFLKLIIDGMADDPEEQLQFVQEAYRSGLHLLGIINDILDIAKIEAGKMQLDLNPIKLDDLLSEVDNFIRPQTQQKRLSFEILTPATRDEVIVYGNYQRLLQVMLNLLGNAIKFTHEGGITITAEVIPAKVIIQEQEKLGFVKISVADTGIGVSLEKQDKLFQSFSQVDGSRTRQYGGTGLGLAISQKLIEAMSGVVNFYSLGEGLGSTVTFTVPLYQDPVMISDPLAAEADLLL